MPNESVALPVSGMTCARCSAHVERALSQVPGVLKTASETGTVIEAADIAPVRGDLGSAINAINPSWGTFCKVMQGLLCVLFRNAVMMPQAMLGVMHPVLAEITMATSSTAVVSHPDLTGGRTSDQLTGTESHAKPSREGVNLAAVLVAAYLSCHATPV